MQKCLFLFLTTYIGVINFATAQKSAIFTDNLRDFNLAHDLYRDHQYASAQAIFEQVKQQNKDHEIQSDCAYYIATCAIKSDQNGADTIMENFLRDYPTSTRTNAAIADVASFYFNQNNFDKALQWFEKVDESNLNTSETAQYNFQKGYAFFATKNPKQATIYFNKVENSEKFGAQAKYYLGYMAYDANNFQEAKKQFSQVSERDQYKEKMSYFQSDMNFRLGNFQKAIDLGDVALAKSNADETSELNKIIGESHFNLKQFNKAIPFLKQYLGKKGKWSNTDYYILGYCFYKTNDFENAISQFNKIIDGLDSVAQNAYYHLGESYLKTNKKQQALNAFKNASEMDFDQKIKEDAALNYAKLSYDIGNAYQAAPEILTDFLEKYPNNASKAEIETLLISSYITSKNYREAMVLLEKNKTPTNKPAFQKVSFYRGLEFFNENNFKDAISMFKKSIAEPSNPDFLAKATFWKAETNFVQNQFNESLLDYTKFFIFDTSKNTLEFKHINYNLGYNHFKLKQYEQAILFFQNYTSQNPTDKSRLSDAFTRLGDCNFVLTKYNIAIESYTKAIELKKNDVDYCSFQKALCFGFITKNDKKIENLIGFLSQFPKSQYRDDALFELGNTFIIENKTDKAIASFDQLYQEFPSGIYAAKAILKQGLVYYNADKDALALTKLKKVASEFPGSPESLEAVATARLIYVDQGKINDYADWVKTLNFVQVTDVELDNDSFTAAEKQYLENKTNLAIEGFENYNARFGNGSHSLKSNFFLAQLYYANAKELKAIPNYEFVVSKPKNEFTEQSLVRLSDIYIKSKNSAAAILTIKRLEIEADFPQNIAFAQANLMKLYFEKNDFENAVVYSERVQSNPKSSEKVRSDALIIVARSAIKTNNESKARSAYAKLQEVAKGEMAAEALFYDAYFKNKDGKFELSNVAIQKLSKNYGSYKYYAAKGLIVMAKNFYGLKDAFQANYILDSVIKNFSDFADVIEDAKTEKARILTEEGKTNSSIQK